MPTGPESFDFLDPSREAAPQSSTDAVGGELGRLGHYRILEVLGRGGMGQVFRAQDARLQREVALKVMNKKFSATPNSRTRFLEEARAMAAIDHDNVVTIYEVGESSGTPFMAMELLKGETLEKTTRSGMPLAPSELVEIAKQLVSGLSAAHRRGIVHRDVKPGNIWIESPSGRVRVLDFGLALASSPVDALANSGSVIGTPGYLSPEQARGERLDDRSDLFSAGVVLYELACGKPPFGAQSIPQQLIKVLAHEPPRPDVVEPRVPRQLADVIMRMLAKEPRERFRSAALCVDAWTEAAQAAEAEKQAAVKIVLEPVASGAKASGEAVKKAGAESSKLGLWNDARVQIGAVVAAVLLVAVAAWYAFRGQRRVAQKPSEPVPVAREVVVLAKSLDVLTLAEIPTAPPSVYGGEQTRYRVVLVNGATSPQTDPRRVNAGARVIAQVATYLYPAREPGQSLRGTRRSVAFPRKLSASMLPAPGQSREIEIDFASSTLAPGQYEVEFELQSPQGTPINRMSTTLRIDENLATIDLIGFDRVRTSQDTFVKTDATDDFGGRPAIEIDRQAPKEGGVQQSHAYLRFDLAGWQNRGATIDRVLLLMTLEPGGLKGKCTLEAYGVTQRLPQDWNEKGDQHLAWIGSPSDGSIEGLPFLGRVEFDNSGGQLEKRAHELRLFGPGLDDYLRSSETSTITILLVRSTEATAPTKLVSREGSESEAPTLAIRRRR